MIHSTTVDKENMGCYIQTKGGVAVPGRQAMKISLSRKKDTNNVVETQRKEIPESSCIAKNLPNREGLPSTW